MILGVPTSISHKKRLSSKPKLFSLGFQAFHVDAVDGRKVSGKLKFKIQFTAQN